MKLSSVSLGTTTSLFLAVALSACGGGGDAPSVATPVASAPAPAPSVSPTVFSQDTARLLAGLGLSTAQLLHLQTLQEHTLIGGLFQSLTVGAASGSFGPTSATCASSAGGSGSLTVSETKSGTYVGYKVGDSLSVTFNACKFASSTIVTNGRFVVVSRGNYANLSPNSVVEYSVTTTVFDISIGSGSTTAKFRSDGVQNAKFDTTVGGTSAPDVTVAVGSGRAVASYSPATAPVPSITYAMSPGVVINAKLTAASNFAATLNGALSANTSTVTIPLLFATNPALTGPASTTLPTAGILSVKDTGANLQTETTYLGSIATVKADTNRDGILDLTFNTTPQALLTFN
jgi:hypothetical protein